MMKKKKEQEEGEGYGEGEEGRSFSNKKEMTVSGSKADDLCPPVLCSAA